MNASIHNRSAVTGIFKLTPNEHYYARKLRDGTWFFVYLVGDA